MNYVKFDESTPMTRLGVIPGNSRNVQRMTQVLHLSHNEPANNAKSEHLQAKHKISNLFLDILHMFNCVYVAPQRSWGDRSDTDHSKCLLLGGRRLNLLTVIPKPKGSGSARAAMAQIGPANERNKTK